MVICGEGKRKGVARFVGETQFAQGYVYLIPANATLFRRCSVINTSSCAFYKLQRLS